MMGDICQSCVHKVVCIGCDDTTMVCNQYLNENDLLVRILTTLEKKVCNRGDLKPFVLWEDIEAIINDILKEK